MLHFIAKKQVSRAAGYVKHQRLPLKQRKIAGGVQCGGNMPLLVGQLDHRQPFGQCKRRGGADASQKAPHIRPFHRAWLG